MSKCKFCNMTPTIDKDWGYDNWDNEISIARGSYTKLYIGVDEKGKVCIRACGDDYTDNYYPKYCPECGRKLIESEAIK